MRDVTLVGLSIVEYCTSDSQTLKREQVTLPSDLAFEPCY